MSKKLFGLNTVRKKVLLLSKLLGGTILVFYLLTSELAPNQSVAFWVWFFLLTVTILGADHLLEKMISRPLQSINKTAQQMAELDGDAHCSIKSNDEFGELAHSLNLMFDNLNNTLKKLETANLRLEEANVRLTEDVGLKRALLNERKELADSLSHEMKTPLGIIRAYTEGLREEIDEEKRQHYTATILNAVRQMDEMIVSLLDLSALEAGASKLKNESFDFVELTETVAGRLLIDIPDHDFRLSYELPKEKIHIYADKDRMRQVLTNLIENGKKYVSSEGELRIAIYMCSPGLVHFSIFNEGDNIPEAELPKVWKRFYRGVSPANGSGSGLGLSIVSQILTAYGADYGVKNQANGVEFYFNFPVESSSVHHLQQ